MNSYNNAIDTLNNATSKYLNTTYADASRCVGSIQNYSSSQEGFATWDSFSSSYNGRLKRGSSTAEIDWKQMQRFGLSLLNNADDEYWLASRWWGYSNGSENRTFGMRYINEWYVTANEDYDNETLCIVHSNGSTEAYGFTKGLRPVFHLKDNVKITGGSGTESDPYTLGV